jgi:O-antigen/teichoic acid export membrane protein
MEKIKDILSKRLGIDLSYVVTNGGIIAVSHTIGTGCGLVITLLLANFIDSTTYGQYKYAISVAGIIGAFSLTGAGSAVLQSIAKGFEGSYKFERRLSLGWGLPSIVISILVGAYYIAQGNPTLGWGIMLLGAIGYAQSILLLHTWYLNGKKDFKRLSHNQIFAALTNLCGVVLTVFAGLTSIIWLIVAYNGAQVLFQLYAAHQTERAYVPQGVSDPQEQTLSRHLSFGNIIPLVSEYLDKILIFQLLGPFQLAVYTFAVGIPDQIRSVNKLINTIVIPKLNEKDPKKLRASVRKHTKTYVIITFALVIIFWCIAEPLYSTFFPQYVESVRYATLYILILPIIASGMLAGHALQIERHIGSLYSIRLVDSLAKIILYITLIPKFGVLGAILSILIAKAATIILQIVLYVRGGKKISD